MDRAAAGTTPPHALTPALEVCDLSKTFGATRALRGVSLEVLPGEVHAVLGGNGSGKSTLVKILSGFHTPDDDGHAIIRVQGDPISLHDPEASRAAGLRFVHQDLALVRTLNTVDNLALGSTYRTGFGQRVKWKEHTRDAQQRLADLGFHFDVLAPVSELQASERTGIAIARAIEDLDAVKVLVFDEPTATLPQAEVEVLFRTISRLQSLGIGIIYISHRLSEIFAIADRVTVLRDGARVDTRAVAELTENDLISLMLGSQVADASRIPRTWDLGPTALELTNVSAETLLEVSLTVQQGEIVGVAGLTGSGRDELLACVYGASTRNGTVQVHGTPLAANNPLAAKRAGLSFVPPDRRQQAGFDALSITANISITDPPRYTNQFGAISTPAEHAESQSWVDRLTIRPGHAEALFAQLSGGNQQKVVFARWLRMNPKVYLLDDPTQGVDIGAKVAIHSIIRDTARDGAGVLVASSDEEELAALCDRIIVLRDGEIAGELLGDRITTEEIMRLHSAPS